VPLLFGPRGRGRDAILKPPASGKSVLHILEARREGEVDLHDVIGWHRDERVAVAVQVTGERGKGKGEPVDVIVARALDGGGK
jgi:hypothetical protein